VNFARKGPGSDLRPGAYAVRMRYVAYKITAVTA